MALRPLSRFRPRGDGDSPPPPDTATEVVELLEGMSPEEAYEWLNEHASNLTSEQMTGAYIFTTNAGQRYGDAQMVVEEEGGRRIGNGTWEPPSSTNPTGGRPQQGANTTAFPEPTGSSPGGGATAPTPQPGNTPEELEEAGDRVATTAEGRDAYDTQVTQQADFVATQIVEASGQDSSIVMSDLSDTVRRQMEAEGVPEADIEAAVNEAMELGSQQAQADIQRDLEAEGADPEQAEQMAEETVTNVTLRTEMPPWMWEAANSAGQLAGGDVSNAAKQRFLSYYNDLYGTAFDDFDQLVAATGADGDANMELQTVWEAALTGQDPLSYEGFQDFALQVEVPGRNGGPSKKFTVDAEELNRLRTYYNLDTNQIRQLAYEANLFGPSADLTGIAAIQQYYSQRAQRGMGAGAQDALTARAGAQDTIAQFEARYGRMSYNDVLNRIEELEATISAAPVSERQYMSGAQELEALKRYQEARRNAGPTSGAAAGSGSAGGPGIVGASNRFNAGLDKYRGDFHLALIHSVDPGLAARIAATGGDPEKLSDEDNREAWSILNDSGSVEVDKRTGRNSGPVAAAFADYWNFGRGGSGGRGGGGRVRRLIDETAVMAQVDELWRAMFRQAAPNSLVKEFTKQLQAQLDAAPEGMDFDASARIEQFLKGTGVYGEMYGKKPAGVTEEEYQQQFAYGQASMLGNELPGADSIDPIAEGMKQGQYQTTVGATVGLKESWGNSTFLGRLAQAAQTIADNT